MTSAVSNILSQLPLHSGADSTIRKAVELGDPGRFQSAFETRLTKARKRYVKTAGKDSPFLMGRWSLPDVGSEESGVTARLAVDCRSMQVSRQRLKQLWQHLAGTFPGSAAERVLSVVAATEMLLRHSEKFEADELIQLIERLLQLDFGALLEEVREERRKEEHALWDAIVLGELPFKLSLLLEPFADLKQLRKLAVTRLAHRLDEVTDSDGTPHAVVGRQIEDWICAFSRTALMADAFKESWCSDDTAARWKSFVKRATALMTPEGFVTQPPLVTEDLENPGWTACVMLQAAQTAGFSSSSAVLDFIKTLQKSASGKRKKNSKGTNANNHSEWAATALLRNDLTMNSDVLSVDWDQTDHRLSLSARGTQLFNGVWSHCVTVDGVEQIPVAAWACTCWFQDDEVAFVELEATSSDGLRYTRHVMLALEDHFAIINETAAHPRADAQLHFQSQLTTVGETSCEMNSITRDLWLRRNKLAVRAVPVWLADDRLLSTPGSCGWKNGQLLMTAEGLGGVSVPMLLDWHPDRKHRDADWNRLTVTERREVVTAHAACGFRARIGRLQLMIYRSLRRGENQRALLGQHTSSETIYGRVRNSGSVAPIVHVESEE